MDLEGCLVGDRYEVKRRLQSGYFGTTWLARDRQFGYDVCLKTFFSESASQKKELVILQQLCKGHFEHDHLCRVLDVCMERAPVVNLSSNTIIERIQYVVFEYCSGSDLFNFLCSGPWEKRGKVSNFSESLARHYFKQILLGVMYLHERGMYHRDIKPENCVLDSNLNLKLTDFGTNKYFTGADPMKLIRTKTRGVGTESYRAPEVNSGLDYDPAAADVWSLGVTLFFFVGVEQMFAKVQTLDAYSKQIIAPLGIFYPFPLHCSKLDSYLRREHELRGRGFNGGLSNASLPNSEFWMEWTNFQEIISSDLRDLFNRIFVLVPTLRITLRDILRHPWVNVTDGISPDIIKSEIESRCPSAIRMSRDASPVVMGTKLLGGVDQVVLRESLSGVNKENIEFPEDAETWAWSLQIEHLESVLLLISGGDIQEVVIDIESTLDQLRSILKDPSNQKCRCVIVDCIKSEWIIQLFLILGFLPRGSSLILLDEYLDLTLLNHAVSCLQGVDLAVSRAAINTISNGDYDNEEMEMEGLPLEEESVFKGSAHYFRMDSVDGPSVDSNHTSSVGIYPPPTDTTSVGGAGPLTVPNTLFYNRSISGEEDMMSQETPIGSSQGSQWTAGSMSTQSSQDELPEGFQLMHDWNVDYSSVHRLIELNSCLQVNEPKQYKAAAEFCKISGLLCSYGLYQVVCHDQLAVYCRGNTAYFSVRIVHNLINGQCKAHISTWCFSGHQEWIVILEKLMKDML